MVRALISTLSGLGWSLGRGHCAVFLGKTLNSHSASHQPGVKMGETLLWTNIPFGTWGRNKMFLFASCYRTLG